MAAVRARMRPECDVDALFSFSACYLQVFPCHQNFLSHENEQQKREHRHFAQPEVHDDCQPALEGLRGQDLFPLDRRPYVFRTFVVEKHLVAHCEVGMPGCAKSLQPYGLQAFLLFGKPECSVSVAPRRLPVRCAGTVRIPPRSDRSRGAAPAVCRRGPAARSRVGRSRRRS